MDLVQKAAFAVISLDGGFSFEEVFEQKRASRAINARETADAASRGQSEIFGLAQQAAGFAIGIGKARFIDRFARDLRIDAGAAGVERKSRRKGRQQVPHAVHIDGLIHLRAAAAAAGAVDEGLRRCGSEFLRELLHGVGAADVAGLHVPRFAGAQPLRGGGAVREADDAVPGGVQQIGRALADEAASGDENGHRRHGWAGLRNFW